MIEHCLKHVAAEGQHESKPPLVASGLGFALAERLSNSSIVKTTEYMILRVGRD